VGTWELASVGVFTLLIFAVGKPLLFLFALLKVQYRRLQCAVIEPAELPEDVRAYLERGAEPFVALGFEPQAWLRVQTLETSAFGDIPTLAMVQPASGARALIAVSGAGNGLRRNFTASFEDGSDIHTVHGESSMLISTLPNTEVVDCSSADLNELWKVFSERFEAARQTRTVVRHDAQSLAISIRDYYSRLIDAWCADGTLQPSREAGLYELTLKRAWHWAWRLGPAQATYVKFLQQAALLYPEQPPLSERIRGYQKTREMVQRRSTRWRWYSLLVVSGVLFAVSMLRFVDATDLLVLVLAVLFHELGHFAAMRLFGYRDTSIFFIPFFGAAASGVKQEERAHEQLAVLLAGPMPGIVIGLALLFLVPDLEAQPWLESLAGMLVVLNVFNLLPIYPLDGGRIVQLLFGNLPPFVEVGFKALSALALLGMGVLLTDPVLTALSLVLLFAARTTKRAADAVRRIRKLGPLPVREEARLELVFNELTVNQPSLPPRAHHAVALPVADRLRQVPLRIPGMLTWSGVYFGCAVTGVLAVAVVAIGPKPFGAFGDALSGIEHQDLPCARVDAMGVHGAGAYSLQCSLADSAKLLSLRAELEEFESLPHRGCLRAPWHAGALSAEQSRARHTVALLAAVQRQAWRRAHDMGNDDTAATLSDAEASRRGRERMARAELAGIAALKASIRARATDPTFDTEVAALVLNGAEEERRRRPIDMDHAVVDDAGEPGGPVPPSPNDALLIERLGGDPVTCDISAPHSMSSSRMDEADLVVSGFTQAMETTTPELARFLCAAGCGLRYWTSPGTRVGSGE
jgi:Zn-dependent protease